MNRIRKEFLLKESRKLIYVALLLVLQAVSGPVQKELMEFRFQNAAFDFIYVLFVAYIPSLISSLIALTLFYFAISIAKMIFLPLHYLEKKYFGLKGWNLKAVAIYSILLAAILYDPDRSRIGSQTLGSVFPGFPLGGGGGFEILLAQFFYYVIVFPLTALFPLKLYTLAAGALYAAFLVHILSVRTLERKANIYRACSPRISQENSWVNIGTKIISPLPIFSYVLPARGFRKEGIVEKKRVSKHTDLSGMHIERESKCKLKKGFYSADIVRMWVVTLPFFVSRIHRASQSDASVTVIPPARDVRDFRTAPLHMDERSEIVSKKILGSSSDFSGIKEYIPGDPLNRVWWMGLAKHKQMLTKTFYGTGEDNIILMPDMSNPDSEKKYSDALIKVMVEFINLCSRKDISLSIFPVSSYPVHAEATRNKKELMFLLMNLGTVGLLSPRGASRIFEDALPKSDYSLIMERCNRNNISLSSLYGASGFYGRTVSVFSWERNRVFRESTLRFFRYQKKRSKIILLTDRKVPPGAMDDFRKLAIARKFRYVSIVLGDMQKEHTKSIDALRERHIRVIPMSYEDAGKMSRIYPILGGKVL